MRSADWDGAPWLRLHPAGRYFEVDGVAQPLSMRNVSAPDGKTFADFLEGAKNAGTRLARVHLTQGMGYSIGIGARGEVQEAWFIAWDQVFDEAARRGISVIPVFAIWGDWNDGDPDLDWANWPANPLNATRGGPAASPGELFHAGPTQEAWLHWMGSLVDRWQPRANVAGWEIFSELDLASGADEDRAVAFVELAASAIRERDPERRPILASTSDLAEWPSLWASSANDIVQFHPYNAGLDRRALEGARARLSVTDRPILIGESGLDAARPDGTTVTSSARARVGLRHAIWAELVSGAANVRAFWWEDGYAVYFAPGRALVKALDDLEATVPEFLGDLDFTSLAPAVTEHGPLVLGAALASADRVVAWFRDAECFAPEWSCDREIASEVVRVHVQGSAADAAWTLRAYDPASGVWTAAAGNTRSGVLEVTLPAFRDSIAFHAAPRREAP